jgi:hypothetical protein
MVLWRACVSQLSQHSSSGQLPGHLPCCRYRGHHAIADHKLLCTSPMGSRWRRVPAGPYPGLLSYGHPSVRAASSTHGPNVQLSSSGEPQLHRSPSCSEPHRPCCRSSDFPLQEESECSVVQVPSARLPASLLDQASGRESLPGQTSCDPRTLRFIPPSQGVEFVFSFRVAVCFDCGSRVPSGEIDDGPYVSRRNVRVCRPRNSGSFVDRRLRTNSMVCSHYSRFFLSSSIPVVRPQVRKQDAAEALARCRYRRTRRAGKHWSWFIRLG